MHSVTDAHEHLREALEGKEKEIKELSSRSSSRSEDVDISVEEMMGQIELQV